MSKIENLINIYDGNEWQTLANKLLLLKYGQSNFQKVPDQHLGDWGIEGYTLSGDVFQCYAPDRQHEVEKLYNLQRSKITEDINKFKKNQNELIKLLPKNVKFRRWYFITTVHISKKVPSHCSKKTAEVIAECSHVEPDFAVQQHFEMNFDKFD